MIRGACHSIARVAIALLACACDSGTQRVDFSEGGGEVELACETERNVGVDARRVQEALARALPNAAFEARHVRRQLSDDGDPVVTTIVRTNLSARSDGGSRQRALDAVLVKLAHRQIVKARWSGERLHVRSKQPIAWQEAASVLAGAGFELNPWTDEQANLFAQVNEATGEYDETFSVAGLDRQLQKIIEDALDVRCRVLRFELVGPRR